MKTIRASLLLAALWLSALPVAAQELPQPPDAHLVVEGIGVVEAVPDIATLHFEISATGTSLAVAKRDVDALAGKAVAAARKSGVKEEHISASDIQAQPQYDWHNNGRVYRGEQVSRQFEVRLLDVNRYNELVEALLGAGVSRLQNVALSFSQQSALEQSAMKSAVDAAKTQAANLAGHLNMRLMGLYQVMPLSQGPVIYGKEMRAMAADAAEAPPAGLTVGKQKIEQRVRLIYLLED